MTQGNPPYGQRDLNATDIDRSAEESGSQIKETIEDATRRVREKVSDATQEVRDKAGNATQHVREQVAEAAEQVRGFDVQQQVRSHPWMALGVAAIAGYVFGSMGGSSNGGSRSGDSERYRDGERYDDDRRSRTEQRASKDDMRSTQAYYWSPSAAHTARPSMGFAQQESYGEHTPRYSPAMNYTQSQYGNQAFGREQYDSQAFGREQHSQGSQLWGNVRDQFGDEFRTMMTAAIGAAISLVRDTVSENVPQFAEEYDRRRREHDEHNPSATSGTQTGTHADRAAMSPNRPLGASDDRARTAQHVPTFGSESGGEQRSGFNNEPM